MSVIDKTIQVSEASDKLAQCIVALVQVIYTKLSDGFQIDDAFEISTEGLKNLIIAVNNAKLITPEFEENLPASIKAFANAGVDIAAVFIPKKAA